MKNELKLVGDITIDTEMVLEAMLESIIFEVSQNGDLPFEIKNKNFTVFEYEDCFVISTIKPDGLINEKETLQITENMEYFPQIAAVMILMNSIIE